MLVLTSITPATTFVTRETRARGLTLIPDAIDDTEQDVAARPGPLVASYRGTTTAPVPAWPGRIGR